MTAIFLLLAIFSWHLRAFNDSAFQELLNNRRFAIQRVQRAIAIRCHSMPLCCAKKLSLSHTARYLDNFACNI